MSYALRFLRPLLLALILGSRLAAADDWHGSRLNDLKHSDIALMPEGAPRNFGVFRSLHPTLVAWGDDPVWVLAAATASGITASADPAAIDRVRRTIAAYRQVGATRIATNVWMLTATEQFLHAHPEYADTACVDLWGAKIVPGWLRDADFKGAKPWWGCTNNPRFRALLRTRMRVGLLAGATMVHLDDHSGTAACAAGAGGCFCPYCLAGFRAWLPRHAKPRELAAAGVTNPADFDYGAFLRGHGYPDRAAFIQAAWRGTVPLWPRFLEYQRDAEIAFIDDLQHEAARVAGRPVPFGVNAWNLEPKQLFDAHIADYFANEVSQLDQEDLIPPVVYRLGEALGRPTFATGTGDDWVAFHQSHAVNRVRGWIAEAYAFGQYFMYAWNKWGFSEKTGTVWTEVDPEVFRPMFDFVRANPDLFDGFDNPASVGLLYDNAAANRNHWEVRNASKALLDAGVPYRLVVDGDDILRHPLRFESLAGVSVLVVPADASPSPESNRTLSDWTRKGGTVLNWTRPGDSLPGAAVRIAGGGRIWALPRVRSAASAGQRTTAVVHLLNRDYTAQGDTFMPKRHFRLSIDLAAIGSPPPAQVRYFRPGSTPEDLRFTCESHWLTVEIPELDCWGIVQF